jgi:diguanylate cyclase (GGDEF)-like protein
MQADCEQLHASRIQRTFLPISAAFDMLPIPEQDILLSALAQTAMPVALYDPGDMLCYANKAFDEAFLRGLALPVAFADVLRHGFHQGFGICIDCGDIEAFLADILPRRRQLPHRQVTTDLHDGRWIQFTETLLPDGWLLTMASDITALKQNEQTIRHAHASAMHAALTDALTGVSNRRHILDMAEQALACHAANGGALAVVLLDLDHFKHINDAHGHQAGDAVLQHFCRQALQYLRPGDGWGRLGGEEFLLLLLPGADAQVAASVVERLRAMPPEADVPTYTFSAGVAQARPVESLQHLLRRADAALYAAKAAGRNGTVVAPPS